MLRDLLTNGEDTRGMMALFQHAGYPEASDEFSSFKLIPGDHGVTVDVDAPSGDPGAEADTYTAASQILDGRDLTITKDDLVKIAHYNPLVKREEIDVAFQQMSEFRYYYGLLQQYKYSYQSGMYEWFTIVPSGGWISIKEKNGKTRRYGLRKYIVKLFHDTPMGGHRDRDHTRDAIVDSGLTWKGMKADIDSHIRACQVCRWSKGRTLVTGLVRSREMEGPFRVLIMDFVGPQYPKTQRGNLYMFTCICPFSGFFWAIPVPDEGGQTAAIALAERVMFDLAGVVCLICSDRGKVFVEGVIARLNETFGIIAALGSSLHPESQGAVERPHRAYKTLCKQFMDAFNDQWDTLAPLFQRRVRTTCKLYNGKYTPYEISTGLKPRLMSDALFATPAVLSKPTTDDYVTDLVQNLKKTHQFVQREHERIRGQQQDARLRNLGPTTPLEVGDYVMMKNIAKGGKSDVYYSQRFRHDTDRRLFQVHSVTGGDVTKAKTYFLMGPSTGSTQFEFAQPVHGDRLIPVEVLPLTQEHEASTKIRPGSRTGEITATCVDGKVYVQWEDETEPECVDLIRLPHEFLT